MRYFLGLQLLLAKCLLLGCFSLMGLGEVLADDRVPCHAVVETEQECPVCPLAFEAWESEMVLEVPEVDWKDVEFEVAFEQFELSSVFEKEIPFVADIRPPPKILPDESLLAFNTVRLIL